MHGRCCACLTRQAFWNNIVITMRAVHVSIRQIGNSQGVVIPKPVLAPSGLDAKAGVEMTIEDGALVLRRPASPARTGWAEAARSIAEAGDDELVMGEFGNAGIRSWSGGSPFRTGIHRGGRKGLILLDRVRAVDKARLAKKLGAVTAKT